MGMRMRKFINFIKKALKDKTNLIIFSCVVVVLFAPTWLFAILGVIFNNGWLLGFAAAYWAFWLAPLTPFWMLSVAITFAVRKIVDKIRKRGK